MDLKNFEQLESLLGGLVDEIHRLRAENLRLEEDVARVGGELEVAVANEKKNRGKIEKVAVLERAYNKMESANTAARLKVQNILTELEKTDWS